MTQRGIGRSALAVGLLVFTLLVGGRMVGTWRSGQVSQLAQADHHPKGGTRGLPAAHPAPAPFDAMSKTPDVSKPSQTRTTGSDSADVGKTPASPKPPAKPPTRSVSDPTFGAIRATGSTAVALTFDDGPHPTWTPQVLDLLAEHGVKATFCLIGVQVRTYPQLVKRMVKEGHTLCNHTWKHDIKLGQKTRAQIRADLDRTNSEIHKAVPDAKITYYRQPGGAWTADIVAVAKGLGMTPLGWSVDPSDWDKPGTEPIINVVTKHTRAGSIVLLHDGGGDRAQTLAACRTVVPWLKQRYKLIALD